MTAQACPAKGAGFLRLFWVGRLAQRFVHPRKNSGWLSLLIWFIIIFPAQAALEMRVAIEQDVNQVKVGSSTPAVLRDGSGQVLAEIPGMNAILATARNGRISVNQLQTGLLWVEPSNDGYVYIENKWYRGRTLVVPTSGGLTAVNYVDLEHYLYSVVGAEMPASWHLEALKAQAVAARTYALYQRRTGANAVFDVGDTTRWQEYPGLERETPSTRAAVDATRGQVITHNGQIINAVFHSCAGGFTENVEDIWTNPLPYLRAVPSPDQDMAGCRWNPLSFTAEEMSRALGYGGTITSIAALERNSQGRVARVTLEGSAGAMNLRGRDLRERLGLKSTLFSIDTSTGAVASAGNLPRSTTFRITGSGFGHGVGMSQYGAYHFAQQGWNYQQILLHYYTGVALAQIEVR